MAKTFLYATDNSTAFIIIHGKDDNDAQTIAEQAITVLPGIKLQGRKEIDHSLIINLSLTLLAKAKSDDVLMRRLLEKFKDREAKIELKNDLRDDGSVQKKILVNDREAIFLNLTPEQVLDFEENGLEERYMENIFKRLEVILRRFAVKSEIIIGGGGGDGNNDDEIAGTFVDAVPAELQGGGDR
jgi:hypothetical protein